MPEEKPREVSFETPNQRNPSIEVIVKNPSGKSIISEDLPIEKRQSELNQIAIASQ